MVKSRQGPPKITHGFNRGSWVEKGQSPGGGERKCWKPQPGSAVPDGTHSVFAPKPTDESVGYSLSPYRAGAHSKSCSKYHIAPINLALGCAPNTQQRSANILALESGQCPQDDMAFSHSRFQASG